MKVSILEIKIVEKFMLIRVLLFLLQAHQELWSKELELDIEYLLALSATGINYIAPVVN